MAQYFDITAFGAVGDGSSLNTVVIQQAIDACHAAGGGVVWCGPGRFVTGALTLKSNVELHVSAGCRLIASGCLEDYAEFKAPGFRHDIAPENSSQCLIAAADADNIAITGGGTIDGNGLAFYRNVQPDPKTNKYPKPPTPRPRIVMFYRCRDVRLEQVTLVESPCWTCWLMRCQRVQVHRVKIFGSRRMRNVDGLDVDGCGDVTVSDCFIRTEDDCLVLRAMRPLYDDGQPVVCENVTITNCVLESGCQGVRVGCPSDGVIRHCTLSNLVIESANNGINFDNPARYLRDEGSVDIHDISFSNVTIRCARSPIRIYVEEGIAIRRIADLRFSNMQIECGQPCLIQGNAQSVIENVRLTDVQLRTRADEPIRCRHARGVKLSHVEMSSIG
jgi:polygalacturonase